MIKKQKDKTFNIICDDCGKVLVTDTDDFYEAVDYAKDDYWKVTKQDGEWQHFCDDCRN